MRLQELGFADGSKLQYVIGLPEGLDAARATPVLIAMPPGAETLDEVNWGLELFWGEQAVRRGWIVVSPVAPQGGWEGATGLGIMQALLDGIAGQFNVEGQKFHLAGCSRGGISAFQVALALPQRFHSLTTLPGRVGEADLERLDRLEGMSIRLFVGQRDGGWVSASRRAYSRLRELGVESELTVFPGEGHVLQRLTQGALIEMLDDLRPAP